VEERLGVREHGGPQREEPLDEPLLDVGLLGVDVDREVEEVLHVALTARRDLQNVEALDDHDVGLAHDLLLAFEDVVAHV